jgi:hypothetical protein
MATQTDSSSSSASSSSSLEHIVVINRAPVVTLWRRSPRSASGTRATRR